MRLMRSDMISGVGTTRVPAFDGSRLQQAREAKNWTRGRLAAAVNKTVVSISGWERNARTPEPATLVALAAALDLNPGDLLDLPRSEWGMVEFRVTRGLQQQEVAKAIGVHPVRFSHFEATYERPTDEHFAAIAREYKATVAEIVDAWERTRARFTTDLP
jgi:transcriptional regulator with XRE-family HTH domain